MDGPNFKLFMELPLFPTVLEILERIGAEYEELTTSAQFSPEELHALLCKVILYVEHVGSLFQPPALAIRACSSSPPLPAVQPVIFPSEETFKDWNDHTHSSNARHPRLLSRQLLFLATRLSQESSNLKSEAHVTRILSPFWTGIFCQKTAIIAQSRIVSMRFYLSTIYKDWL